MGNEILSKIEQNTETIANQLTWLMNSRVTFGHSEKHGRIYELNQAIINYREARNQAKSEGLKFVTAYDNLMRNMLSELPKIGITSCPINYEETSRRYEEDLHKHLLSTVRVA